MKPGLLHPERVNYPLFITQLYGSGKYSDLIIKCQDQKFKVHRAIVCSQSQPLAAAIDHDFKEAITGETNFEDDEPEIVGYMISFLYNGTYFLKVPKESRDSATKSGCDALSSNPASSKLSVKGLLANNDNWAKELINAEAKLFEIKSSPRYAHLFNAGDTAATTSSSRSAATASLIGSSINPPASTSGIDTNAPEMSFGIHFNPFAVRNYSMHGAHGTHSNVATALSSNPSSLNTIPATSLLHSPAATAENTANGASPVWATTANASVRQTTATNVNTSLDNQLNAERLGEDLVKHAKIYIIGEKYDIQDLKTLARERYALNLFLCWNSSGFVQSIELVFDGTPDTAAGDNLRLTIVDAASIRAAELLQREDFSQLLQDRGDISTAILQARIKKE